MSKKQKRNFSDIMKYLNREEWDRLRNGIDNYWDKLMIEILYASGMRIGELTKLRIEDIDFKERFIKILAENTKTKTGQTVWIPQELLNEIKAYLKLNKKRIGRLLDLTPRQVQQLFNKYLDIAQIKATPHTLRHTHIVHALLNKIPITAVQKQVGHKRLTTTQIYSDFAPEQVREAYEKRTRREETRYYCSTDRCETR